MPPPTDARAGVLLPKSYFGTDPIREDLLSEPLGRLWTSVIMETIEVVEDEQGWTVKHGSRVLFIDTVEERTFKTALAITNTLFDEGVRARVVLIRRDN